MAADRPRAGSSNSQTRSVLAHRTSGRSASWSLFTQAQWRQLTEFFGLTPRQAEIARLICENHTYLSIGNQLGISVNTVRMHIRALFQKLDVNDRVGLVLRLVAADRLLSARPRAPASRR